MVRDIHPVFGITSVPALLELSEGKLTNVIKGSHDTAFYKALLDDAFFRSIPADDSKPARSVTVYTTPTCSWCNALKSWLRKNRIAFREVDVSRDERMAQELVRKSGQMGVPQTEIDGQIVVGFNQARLKELLGIAAQ
ncbi:MAG: glutaredoxin [Bacteroidales bacterium]|nr:glutaredoxin [Bacteroidales bacterium]